MSAFVLHPEAYETSTKSGDTRDDNLDAADRVLEEIFRTI